MPSEKIKDENFVSRWSRRKQQITHEEELIQEELEDSLEDDLEEEFVELEKTKEEKLEQLNALTDEDMPDVATLGEDSDYSGFMSINVSEGLRKIALLKLFHGKSYNIRDGLDEYDGDYTSFEKLDPSIITADMKHLLEVEAEKVLVAEKKKEEELLNVQAESDVELDEHIDELDQNEIDNQEEEHEEIVANQNNNDVDSDDEEIDDDVEGDV